MSVSNLWVRVRIDSSIDGNNMKQNYFWLRDRVERFYGDGLLTVFSPETVNIKILANLTANTKNYGKITLNTKPHSDHPWYLDNRFILLTQFSLLNSWTLLSNDISSDLKVCIFSLLRGFVLKLRSRFLGENAIPTLLS